MTLIKVPRPPKSAFNPGRPASALLKMQIEQLHHAEKRLPLRYRTDIYINAIQTEGEAAAYIRDATEAIHLAHADAEAIRQRGRAPKRKGVISIAAVADQSAERKQKSRKRKASSKGKKAAKKAPRKK